MNQISRLVVASSLGMGCLVVGCGGRVNPEAGSDIDSGTGSDAGLDSSVKPGPIDGSPLPTDVKPTPDDAPIFVDGGPTPADSGPIPSATVCDELAKAICGSATKACCDAHKVTYDAAGCEAAEKSYCETQRSWVKSGRLTYDPGQLGNCEAGWMKALTACSVNWIEWFQFNQPCAQLFNGTILAGDKCSYDIECYSPPGGRGYCDTDSNRCRVYDFVGPGKGCNFAGKTIHYCLPGLYCDTTSTTPTCQPQVPLGGTCDGPDDLSCGYNNVCKDGKCALGLPAGATCDPSALECASWSCDGGTCTSTNVELADPSICSGSGLAGGTP
jgi:hypothetical protein